MSYCCFRAISGQTSRTREDRDVIFGYKQPDAPAEATLQRTEPEPLKTINSEKKPDTNMKEGIQSGDIEVHLPTTDDKDVPTYWALAVAAIFVNPLLGLFALLFACES